MPAPIATTVTLPFSITLGELTEPAWYKFTTTVAGDFVATTENSPSTSNDTGLALYNDLGVAIAFNEDIDGDGDYRSRIDYPALPAGTYYVGLTGYPVVAGPGWDLTGDEGLAGVGVVLELFAAGSPGIPGMPTGPINGGASQARLEKITRKTFIPGTPGSPGSPGQPYIPARTVTEVQRVCTYVPYAEVTGVQIVNGQPVPTLYPPAYNCRDVFVQRQLPAQPYIPPSPPVPASPSQTLYDYQFGWNSRARSRVAMLGDGVFSFRVPADSIGVMVGLVPQADPPRSAGYADLRWSFYVSRGRVYVYENGQEVVELGAYPNARLALRRRLGQIIYLIDGVPVRTTPNESVPLVLAAALYSGGDSVDDAEYKPEAGGNVAGVMAPLQAIGGTEAYAFGEGVMAPMVSGATSFSRGSGSGAFLALIGLAGDAQGYSLGAGVMMPLESDGEGAEVIPPYAVGGGYFGVMESAATGLTGTIGSAAAALQPLVSLGSDRPYAEARASMTPLAAYGEDLRAPGEASLISLAVATHPLAAQTILMAVLDSRMNIVGIVSAQVLLDVEVPAGMAADAGMLSAVELQAVLASVMSARALTGDTAKGMSVWAMNTQIGGSTRYENFPFNSLAKLNGKYYGASSEGLFLLDGRDDDGAPVAASIDFGNLNFGTMLRKALPYVYIGMASDSRVVLKVVADGQTYFYDLRDSDETLKPQRFELGRGLRASYYGLSLISEEGALFEVADIEFTPVTLNRRL